MARLRERVFKAAFGESDARKEGQNRTLRGFREGDNQELYIGLALTALSYLQKTKPKKTLIHRQRVPRGSAIVIHHKNTGTPRLEIIRPRRRDRRKAQTR